jgi:integrase
MSRHQAGYIYERNGAFHVRYYVEDAGERKQKSAKLCDKDRNAGHGSASAKAVVMLCEDFMRGINNDSPTAKALTVVEFWDTIYQPFIESTLKHSTVKGYQQVWNQHLKSHFGKLLLSDYKTSTFSLLLTQLAKTYRPRTLASVKFLTSAIFAHATAMGLTESNPIRDAKVLGKMLPNGETEAYTLEEIENVISALVDHVECQLIMALAFFLGLRKGEIAGLQWGDVDGEYLHIRRAVGRGVVGTPKTRKSLRSVPLIAPVRLFLGLWRKRCRGDGWVFPSQDGITPISLDRVADRMKPILAAKGLSWKGFHAGRRGLGTALRSLTGNSNAGRDMLGHSNAQVTEAHYEAAMPEEVLRGMKLLEGKVKL